MKRSLKNMFFATCLLFTFNHLHAQTKDDLKEVYKFYTQGFYADTLEQIDILKKKFPKSGVLLYWEALCYKKMQEYEDAHIFFSQARKFGYKNPEFNYEHGQTLYALEKYKKALGAFSRSVKSGFKVGESKLYIAQILEELKLEGKAYKFYDSASKEKNDDVAQAAGFQKAKLLNKKTKNLKNPKKAILTQILPKLEEALDRNSDSKLASAINLEIFRIKNKYGLGPKKLRNGNVIPARDWDLFVQERFSYDSNVVLEADETQNQTSNKDSMISFTDMKARHRFVFDDLWVIEPELNMNYEYYMDREASTIYTNDNVVINPIVNFRYEHLVAGKPATMTYDVGYLHRFQDFNARKDLEYYFNQWTTKIGERLNIFGVGPTSGTVGIEVVRGATDALNTLDRKTYTLSFDQVFNLPGGSYFLFLNQNRFNQYDTAITTDSDSYLFRLDYIYPKLIEKIDFNFTTALTLNDFKNQRDTRGVEKLFAPAFFVMRRFAKDWRLKVSYNYNKNKSKDKENNQYSQHIVATELRYNF